jgi:hypothetical protein
MAQSLIIKDGIGAVKNLTVESGSYGFMPVHYVTSSTSAPVYITASSANPLPVTGNISVDVMVGDLITVTSSQANPVWVTGSTVVDVIIGDIINVTASAVAPVYVTGTVTVNTGSLITVTASLSNPTGITGTVNVNNFPSSQTVTASTSNPLAVTGTVNINNSALTVTSSLLSPLYALAAIPPVTTVSTAATTSFVWNTSASGTFAIATNSLTRKGLTIFNPGPHNLFVALSTAGGATNGFTLVSTASAPSVYSFIVYPSGTYVADQTTVGVFHAGYFISGSASVGVFDSEVF